jgi:putative solute:sodium symporter small subunit
MLHARRLPRNKRTERGRTMSKRTYWQDNLRLVGFCLTIWFIVSFGFGILLLDVLNQIKIAGVRLGFWFAQQGSIYVFVLLIFFYARRMAALDHQHGVEED